MESILLINPVSGAKITGSFGETGTPYPATGHKGIDFSCYLRPVRAAHEGVVHNCGMAGGYGKFIILTKGDYQTIYAHLLSVARREGERVKAGDVIGLSGNTGNCPSGWHLHWELQINGKAVDPMPFMVAS